MYCLDSDLLIELLRGKPDAIKCVKTLEGVTTTQFSAHELLFGTMKGSKRYKDALSLLKALKPVDHNWDCMITGVQISQKLFEKGSPIGEFDVFIASNCLAKNMTLVTRNKKHFSKVPGLKVKSW